MKRLQHIDALRGLVILLMALDHTRDFFQAPGASPEALDTTSLPWFAVRWVTHFCAPTFVFLAGVSVALMAASKPKGEVLRFLATRGLWLMLLEPTWVSMSWYFGVQKTHLGVLWAIGGAMVATSLVLAVLPRLETRSLAGVGALGLAGTLALATWPQTFGGPLGWLFMPGSFEVGGHLVSQSYAILPWALVMMMGAGVGRWVGQGRGLAAVGAGLTAAFVGLRWRNGWGDPEPWAAHARGLDITLVDFLNPGKYPPSLDFLLMTLGPALMLLALFRLWTPKPLLTYGCVPMFFYLLHLPLIHLAGVLHGGLRYGHWARMGTPIPAGTENSPALVLGAWVLLVAALYWPCVQWGALKKRRRDWVWLRYL